MLPDPEWAAPDQQNARSELRIKFLRTLDNFTGKKCTITMHDNTVVSARWFGCDVDAQRFLVQDLQTPSGVLASAVLRAIDVIHVDFVDDNGNSRRAMSFWADMFRLPRQRRHQDRLASWRDVRQPRSSNTNRS